MINFVGQVSAQVAPETVTITVTKDEVTVAALTATTLEDGSFASTFDGEAGTGYTAVATVDADAKYKAAASAVVAFEIALGDRTITLSVV